MELGTEFTFQSTSLPQRCFKLFSEMREEDKFCDIKFTVGERQVTAHRVILAAVMPFVGEMLTSENEIQMSDIEPTVLGCLIDYAYSCKLKITMDNVRGLLSGSCVMGMKDVQNACYNFVSQRLQPQNVLSFRDLANDLNLPQLKEFTDLYVKENFEEVSKTKEFLDSPFTYVKDLIVKDDLNVDSEEKVLESVLKWVKSSPSERKGNLPELLRHVRMVSLKPQCLTDIVEREELIRTSVAARDLVDEAKNYNLFPERRKAMCSFSTEARHFMRIEKVKETSKVIYSFSATKKCTILHLDLTNGTWSPKDAKEYSISNFCFAVLDKKMYFFHEYVFEYDSANNKIRVFQPLPVPKKFMAAVSLRNKVFLCGGYVDDFTASNSVDRFDPGKNEWTQVNPMQTARYCLNAVSSADYIYALGGRDTRKIYSTVERYSFVTGKWQYLSSMLTPRYCFGCAVLNGKIYVCGGYGSIVDEIACLTTAEVYDPITSKWNLISPMNTARRCVNLVAFREKLYAIAGENSSGEFLSTCEVYNPQTDKWTYGPCFTPLHRGSVAVVM